MKILDQRRGSEENTSRDGLVRHSLSDLEKSMISSEGLEKGEKGGSPVGRGR
jgi:hypothetical protein